MGELGKEENRRGGEKDRMGGCGGVRGGYNVCYNKSRRRLEVTAKLNNNNNNGCQLGLDG